ncbi:hypothetical protein PHMEG_00014510 [Phytophthora megakarya]|uniref:Retrotransposon gag domain-containing protein n=1 Tax=Phytophthora megakarya TaxID=4795 RepID=A0A225W3M4_9STRA|nr:hypothetical protein PHMEG_00014510 [Phytophthora megakarya]
MILAFVIGGNNSRINWKTRRYWLAKSVKKSALSIFLTGSARRWLRTYRVDHPNASFEETGEALVCKFRPNLTDQEITARIYTEGKRAIETYQEYADRLLQMADGLTGGFTNAANVQHALGMFLRLTEEGHRPSPRAW